MMYFVSAVDEDGEVLIGVVRNEKEAIEMIAQREKRMFEAAEGRLTAEKHHLFQRHLKKVAGRYRTILA